jgi:tetratricopeptide (TPR) repeat protein
VRNFIFGVVLLVFVIPSLLGADQTDFEAHFQSGNRFKQRSAWDEAINEYEQALKINPNHALAHYALSLAYYEKYREIKNINMKKELFRFFSNPQSSNEYSQSEVIDAEDQTTRSLHNKAIQELKKTLELDDTIWGAHYLLGTHYYNIGNYDHAEKELKRTIELKPDYSNSYSILGSLYEKRKDYDLAIEYRKRALNIDPDAEIVHYDLAILYHKLGMKKEAKEEYELLRLSKSVLFDSLEAYFEANK